LFVHNIADSKNPEQKIPVHLDISVFSIKCKYLGLDIQDDLGRHEVGFVEDTVKIDINDGQGCNFKHCF
jgi:hypothetical protein